MSMIGKSLAHYEITAEIGRGGMGEVYQAKDQKLGRDVAIKVLPEEFARDADRVARFQREAKLLASLNHPNIAAIHGLEESGGTHFLVMELIDGQTLADRIKSGPVPVEEALKLSLQIAEALEAAHDKGVIHRDLKPANIKITSDGKVKVLDFGLAKAYAGSPEGINLSNSPTLSDMATQQGVILGTAAYMPPEQAKGKAVDKRADIWAFGVVLFEMLTGRQLFTGETVSETLAAVLMREPDFAQLPANLHPRIRLLFEHCLEKNPKNRCHDIADARIDIQRVLSDPGGVLVQPVTAAKPRKKLRVRLYWVAGALVLGLTLGVAIWKLKPAEPVQVMRFEYEVPEDQNITGIAVSLDGRQFVYSTSEGLYLRSLGELTSRLISGTEGNDLAPFYSPDGKWIGFYSNTDKKLKKVSINGGTPTELCSINPFLGASWGADDKILYTSSPSGIMRISAGGGNPDVIIKPTTHFPVFPQLLPDKKWVMYTAFPMDTPTPDKAKIVIQSLKSGEVKELFPGFMARYCAKHICFSMVGGSGRRLFEVPFDLGKHEVTGEAVPVMEGSTLGDVSESGTAVYITEPQAVTTNTGTPARTLVWVDKDAKEEPLHMPPDYYMWPSISPDGTRVALTKRIGGVQDQQIWIWDLVHETMMPLTTGNSVNYKPIWTKNGERIVFISRRDGKFGIYWKAANGTDEGQALVIGTPLTMLDPWSWSSDGMTLALTKLYVSSDPVHSDIMTLSMEGDHAIQTLLQAEYNQIHPNISPDGKYMAYGSGESGKAEIYVRPFPEVNKDKWMISNGGGESPLWSPDSRELFFRNGDAVMEVSVDTKPAFNASKPRMLFQGPYVTGYAESPAWDISHDGKRFLMIKQLVAPAAASESAAPKPKINIVVNWFEELKQRTPAQ